MGQESMYWIRLDVVVYFDEVSLARLENARGQTQWLKLGNSIANQKCIFP